MQANRVKQRENLRAFLREGKSSKSPFYSLKATGKRLRIIASLFRKAYSPESIVAWRNTFVPTEMLFALDIIPFAAEANCAMFSGSDLSVKPLDIAESNYYSADTCSFLRTVIGTTIADYMASPDFLISTSHYCDGAAKVFYDVSKRYSKDFFLLDTPYDNKTKEAVSYVASQIENIMEKMAKKIGIKINYSKFSEIIVNSNEATKYLRLVNELRKNVPAPMLGGESIDYAAMTANFWGLKEAIELYKLLYEELKERVDKGLGTVAEEKHRILWRNLRAYHSPAIMDYLEIKRGAIIAFEETNYVHWEDMDPKKPYISLAKKILSNPPIGKIENWITKTLEVVEDYKIDGVIEFAHRGCRHLNSAASIVRKELQVRGIPFLILDGDCIDGRDYSDKQIKVRVDAFLELLEGY